MYCLSCINYSYYLLITTNSIFFLQKQINKYKNSQTYLDDILLFGKLSSKSFLKYRDIGTEKVLFFAIILKPFL